MWPLEPYCSAPRQIRSYSIKTGIDRLVVTPVSKASAQQRSGRMPAGRLAR